MDIDTFFTELAGQLHKHAGATAQMSDSEVLTVMLAGQWRKGVLWSSERGDIALVRSAWAGTVSALAEAQRIQ